MVASGNERELVLRSRNGDTEAFSALIRAHQRMIHALTYRMTGSLADAEDLAQETFIQAHQQLDQFRGESSFGTWLYRTAVNRCLNWRKGDERRTRLHEEWGREQTGNSIPGDSQLHRVQEALMQLKPKQRAAMMLTVYEGLNHAQAARVLGCSETTVSWRIFAARAKLKRLLADLQPRQTEP
ncbi:MAG: RNA polymerase sigma factor [Verrucomicrobia bacterium]|jgi:RNA polymerase sigma-70 factor (ECF subfamily)|nr:RNA polymerase sigma factor [Verrucomicrobiota bacterium]